MRGGCTVSSYAWYVRGASRSGDYGRGTTRNWLGFRTGEWCYKRWAVFREHNEVL